MVLFNKESNERLTALAQRCLLENVLGRTGDPWPEHCGLSLYPPIICVVNYVVVSVIVVMLHMLTIARMGLCILFILCELTQVHSS